MPRNLDELVTEAIALGKRIEETDGDPLVRAAFQAAYDEVVSRLDELLERAQEALGREAFYEALKEQPNDAPGAFLTRLGDALEAKASARRGS